MVVTENHPQLLDGIEIVCTPVPIAGEQRTAAATRDLGQGPLKQRAPVSYTHLTLPTILRV